jgi:hypothetical protein
MKGLEPSTFCMARTTRKRQRATLTDKPPDRAKYRKPIPTLSASRRHANLTKNLTNLTHAPTPAPLARFNTSATTVFVSLASLA